MPAASKDELQEMILHGAQKIVDSNETYVELFLIPRSALIDSLAARRFSTPTLKPSSHMVNNAQQS
jgi:hypothetical protein